MKRSNLNGVRCRSWVIRSILRSLARLVTLTYFLALPRGYFKNSAPFTFFISHLFRLSIEQSSQKIVDIPYAPLFSKKTTPEKSLEVHEVPSPASAEILWYVVIGKITDKPIFLKSVLISVFSSKIS